MSMHHRRAVRDDDRLALRKKLLETLKDAPDGLDMQIARAATLSATEAQRLLDMAAERNALDAEQVTQARAIIEDLSVTP